MGRKRSNKIIKGDFGQQDFFGLVDVVTLGTKPHYVEQSDGTWPPYAEVIASRIVSRQPRPLGRRGEQRFEFISDRFPQNRTHKFCSCCAEWVNRLDFSPDPRNRDGLHSWCKPCRNRQARRFYWLQKEERFARAA